MLCLPLLNATAVKSFFVFSPAQVGQEAGSEAWENGRFSSNELLQSLHKKAYLGILFLLQHNLTQRCKETRKKTVYERMLFVVRFDNLPKIVTLHYVNSFTLLNSTKL